MTINRVVMEDVGDGEHKPVVYFQGKEKGLVLNKTNAGSIEEIARSSETDDWRGVRIMLKGDKTDFQGRRVDCIRIDRPDSVAVPAPVLPPPPPVTPLDGDDIPF